MQLPKSDDCRAVVVHGRVLDVLLLKVQQKMQKKKKFLLRARVLRVGLHSVNLISDQLDTLYIKYYYT